MPLIKRGRGRPRKDGSRNHRYEVRMSDDDIDILNEIILKTGKSKAEIVREAIELYGKMVGFKRD